MSKDQLQIDPRIIAQIAKGTVKSLLDGIVELLTNSDDSYKRLEQKGKKVNGEIEIHINRKKGGICEELVVRDFAEGMTRDELEKAIKFAGETQTGKSIRGLFGRGLKETIISFGEGEIKTIKNKESCGTKIWFDKKIKIPLYDGEMLKKIQKTSENNGTKIDISITNDKIKLPEYKTFVDQVSKHYALRDICNSTNRKIKLVFHDLKRGNKHESEIKFSPPPGEKVKEESLKLPGFGDKVDLTIYESPTPLDSPRYTPYGLAGILIKTKGATLDNQLFKFENDSAALYFWGEAICDGLEERLREGETEIVDFNRAGLDPRHEYYKALAKTIEEVLEPLVLSKKKALEKGPEKGVKESTQKMLNKLCNLLNELAKEELEEPPDGPPPAPEPDITKLLIKPEVANIQKDRPRTFSIYAPYELVDNEGEVAYIKSSDPVNIAPLTSTVKLEKHPKYPEIRYRYFKVVGKAEDSEGILTVTLGKETAEARVKVAPPREKGPGKGLSGRRGDFISEIKPDELDSPPQRTRYENGAIKIFINFPSVQKFIKSGLEGAETEEGKILLAELVGEGVCREVARYRLNSIVPPPPGGEIDAFNNEVNRIQRKVLHKIQDIVFSWKFKE